MEVAPDPDLTKTQRDNLENYTALALQPSHRHCSIKYSRAISSAPHIMK